MPPEERAGRSGPRRRGCAVDAAIATAGRVARCPGLRVRARHPRRRPEQSGGRHQGVSNLQAPAKLRLEEAWLQQNLFGDRLSWLVGRYDLNTEFYRLQSAALFLNSSFGIGPEFAQQRPGRALDLSEHLPRQPHRLQAVTQHRVARGRPGRRAGRSTGRRVSAVRRGRRRTARRRGGDGLATRHAGRTQASAVPDRPRPVTRIQRQNCRRRMVLYGTISGSERESPKR